MASGVEELLDMLFEMIDEAKNAPLSSDKCVIERDRALDLIDDIRLNIPSEIKQARAVVADRNEILSMAKQEAEDKEAGLLAEFAVERTAWSDRESELTYGFHEIEDIVDGEFLCFLSLSCRL